MLERSRTVGAKFSTFVLGVLNLFRISNFEFRALSRRTSLSINLRAGCGVDAQATHLGTGPAEGWADAVDGNARLAADVLIGLALEMIQANDLRLIVGQFADQPMHFLLV